jgi:hypothetical protein
MRLVIHERSDGLLVVLPASLPRPPGLVDEGVLTRIGHASVAFTDLSPGLTVAIAMRGFGIADDGDEALLRVSLEPEASAVAEPEPEPEP